MELSETKTFSNFDHQIVASFQCLEDNLNNNKNNVNEKTATWRQQSLIIKSLGGSLTNNCMERHLLRRDSQSDNSNSLDKYFKGDFLENTNGINIKFPEIENIHFPRSSNDGDEMFNEIFTLNDNRHIEDIEMSGMQEQVENKLEETSLKSRNTMQNFLQGQMPAKTQTSSFCSARQLLVVQTLKKQMQHENNTTSQLRKTSNNQEKSEVGFNFAATKKSLGSLGRVLNSTRKNFVSPVRSNSTTNVNSKNEEILDPEIASLLSHPALKNVDPKMVETISNEIIHKFNPVDWNEIAGLDYAKSIIKEAVVYPLLRPDIFTGLRRPPRGILLFGPPGTGKTLIGKCIASQSSSTFFSISSASLTSKWMGEGEKMVRAMFAVAVARQPSVIFIDEIDSLLSQRSENENEGTRRLKTEFLVRLDGAATSDDDRVLIVGATNRPQELDEAVRRRFVKRLYVPLPEVEARAEILTNLLKTVDNNLNSNDINKIAQLADGYSGADMDSLCREASMEPVRSLSSEAIITFNKEQLRPVNMDDFHSALKKIRPSVSQSDLYQYIEWNKTYGSSY